MTAKDFVVGDKVKLRDDVLPRHARSIPAHLGYTKAQFRWREILTELLGQVGTIERKFDGSEHINVQYENELIGINASELKKV